MGTFWVASAQAVVYPRAVGAERPAPPRGWGAWTRAGCSLAMDPVFSPVSLKEQSAGLAWIPRTLASRPNQQRRVSIAGRLLSPQCSKSLREHARQDLCAQVVRRLPDPQDCYGAAPLGLSAKSARIAQDFGFSLFGGAWTRIEGNERVADYELAFRAAGSVSSGRDGTALDFQSATRQACLCLRNGLDHGS